MKCYLHYPREGQTVVINGVQFINGVADMPKLPIYFERYYNVKDYPPQGKQDITVNFNINAIDTDSASEFTLQNKNRIVDIIDKAKESLITEDSVVSESPVIQDQEPSDEELLRMVVEAKKSEIEAKTATIEANLATGPSLVEQYLALDNQGKRIGFVKEHTGKIIRGKDEAVAYLTQIDNLKR